MQEALPQGASSLSEAGSSPAPRGVLASAVTAPRGAGCLGRSCGSRVGASHPPRLRRPACARMEHPDVKKQPSHAAPSPTSSYNLFDFHVGDIDLLGKLSDGLIGVLV
ncbi:hypothetical protein chiPu_0025282, partial [Chiloscyllium punctatum]|nr:hypothetical protein [Chiloscyllium punctatum]